jgi:hypothetical protein
MKVFSIVDWLHVNHDDDFGRDVRTGLDDGAKICSRDPMRGESLQKFRRWQVKKRDVLFIAQGSFPSWTGGSSSDTGTFPAG